jgi:hypothetical protein
MRPRRPERRIHELAECADHVGHDMEAAHHVRHLPPKASSTDELSRLGLDRRSGSKPQTAGPIGSVQRPIGRQPEVGASSATRAGI